MSIEQSLERIASALELLAGSQTGAAPAPAATQKRGPGRPPKAATPSVEASAEPAASAPPAPSTPAPVATTTPAPTPQVAATTNVTKEMVSNQMVKLIKANLRDTVVKILGEHGAQSISALAPSEYEAAYAKAVKATPADA